MSGEGLGGRVRVGKGVEDVGWAGNSEEDDLGRWIGIGVGVGGVEKS